MCNRANADYTTQQADAPPERKQRKSVAFSEGTTIVDENGGVTQTNGGGGEKHSAESHSNGLSSFQRKLPSLRTTTLLHWCICVNDALTVYHLESGDKDVDEVADMLKDLGKKKKKPKKAKEDEEAEAPAADGEFDPSALKKKKKKKPKAADAEDFEAKLAEAGAGEKDEANGDGEATTEEGDLEKGTGIWAHDATQPISYNLLLSRFFTQLHSHHPDLASSGTKNYKIPPPQCLREGNKKTIFANIAEICKRMKRTDEHVTQFLFAELGTSGSVDGNRRLVIKGRFQQKQIENVLRRYIGESQSSVGRYTHPDALQSNTSRARPVGHQILSSAKARTGSISLPATLVAADGASRRSRRVSLHRSASGRGNRVNLKPFTLPGLGDELHPIIISGFTFA